MRGDQTDHFICGERDQEQLERRNVERGPQGRPPRMRKLMRTPKDSHVTPAQEKISIESPAQTETNTRSLLTSVSVQKLNFFRVSILLEWRRFIKQNILTDHLGPDYREGKCNQPLF